MAAIGPQDQPPPAQHAQRQLGQVVEEFIQRDIAPLRPRAVGGFGNDIGVVEAGRQQEERGNAPNRRQAGNAVAQECRDRIHQHAAKHIGKQVGRQVGQVKVRQHDRHGANRHREHHGYNRVSLCGPGIETVVHFLALSERLPL